jgi:ParB family chromosome partitioning protein
VTTRPLNGLAAISVAELHPSPNNPREQLNDIEGLAASIKEAGLIQPLVVQRIPGHPGYQVVAGHRRLAAVKKLGWDSVPCIMRRNMLPDEELLTMLIENGQRSGLDPIEEARAARKLAAAGLTQSDIARRVGRSPNWVQQRLMLLNLPVEEQDAVRAGHSSLGHALGLIRNERQQARFRTNPVARPVGRPKGAKTKPYFGDQHPLARTVRARCSHRGSPKVGGVGCGPCWENAIRADANISPQQAAS